MWFPGGNKKHLKGETDIVFEKIKKIISEQLEVDQSIISEGSSITGDLGADSLETVDLIMKLEQEFDIEIPEEQANNISTVGDAIKFVEDAVANK